MRDPTRRTTTPRSLALARLRHRFLECLCQVFSKSSGSLGSGVSHAGESATALRPGAKRFAPGHVGLDREVTEAAFVDHPARRRQKLAAGLDVRPDGAASDHGARRQAPTAGGPRTWFERGGQATQRAAVDDQRQRARELAAGAARPQVDRLATVGAAMHLAPGSQVVGVSDSSAAALDQDHSGPAVVSIAATVTARVGSLVVCATTRKYHAGTEVHYPLRSNADLRASRNRRDRRAGGAVSRAR